MLSEKDLLNAYEIYLSKNDELFVLMDNSESAYRFSKNTLVWEEIEREYSWKVWNEPISGKKAEEIISNWIKNQLEDKHRLDTAIEFATKKHSGQFRKATAISYILHPLEVLQILYSMRADTNLMIAGILHDTVEDTDTTLDEIREIFGNDVAELVKSNSEDKNKTWLERKQHTINELKNANERVKMLIMADKLSNIRSIAFDYNHIGNELWKRFNAPKEKQAWYYDGILDALFDMQFYPECEKAYWELTELFKDVFVTYYLDKTELVLYQICDDGNAFHLKKGNPQWIDSKAIALSTITDALDESGKPRYFKLDVIPENSVLISRKEAEFLENMWNKPFWDCHTYDIQNGSYSIYSSIRRNINIEITNKALVLQCADYGDSCKIINGKNEYEFSYSLDDENTHRLLVQLRIKHGLECELYDILTKEFGCDNGTALFEKLCRELNIQYSFFSY